MKILNVSSMKNGAIWKNVFMPIILYFYGISMDPTEKTKRNHQEIPLDFADLAMTIPVVLHKAVAEVSE